nr:hypothetical protein [uncultured Enorma sp.]
MILRGDGLYHNSTPPKQAAELCVVGGRKEIDYAPSGLALNWDSSQIGNKPSDAIAMILGSRKPNSLLTYVKRKEASRRGRLAGQPACEKTFSASGIYDNIFYFKIIN